MIVTKATATVAPVEAVEYPHGAFDIILSAQTKDRDGDTLSSDEWKTPLPEHITMDADHGMSVATTVGSGKPFINEDGDLQVRGTYASIPRAQEVRALVNEGHIKTTSVAFMTEKTEKGAKATRELLNGAFVAIPSNREAVILSSKSFPDMEAKAGARNSASDAQSIQEIHDSALALGAKCPDEEVTPADQAASGASDGANKSPTVKTAVADLLADVDMSTLPPAVVQALELAQATLPAENVTVQSDAEPAATPAAPDEGPAAEAAAEAEDLLMRARAVHLGTDLLIASSDTD